MLQNTEPDSQQFRIFQNPLQKDHNYWKEDQYKLYHVYPFWSYSYTVWTDHIS